MSDKNITELEWKKFSKGRGLKDAAFIKALAALENGKTPDAKLTALADIEKQADVLRKANKGDKEITGYLDDADKAVSKERKLQEVEAKKAAKSNDSSGDDEEESPALLTSKMVPLLRGVKKGEVMHVMVAMAGKETSVLLSRRAISPARKKLMQEYMGIPGALKVYNGECIWEENAHTFVMLMQAGGMAKKIKAALLNQTDMRFKVRVRGEDPNDIDDDGEPPELEQGETESTQPIAGGAPSTPDTTAQAPAPNIPPAPPLPPQQPVQQPTAQAPADPDSLAFNTRLAALMPRVKEVIVAAGPTANDLKLKISEAGVFARKKEFPQANALLDDAEKLMGPAGNIPQAPPMPGPKEAPATAPTVADPDATAFNTRLAALMPKVKEVIVAAGPNATDVKLKVSEAGVSARKKEFVQANALLDEAEKLMGGSVAGTTVPGTGEGTNEGSETQEEETSQEDLFAAWATRFAEVEPLYLEKLKTNPAEATGIRALMGLANDAAEAEDYAKGVGLLNQLMDALNGATKAKDTGFKGIVEYRKTLIDLRAAVAKVEGQIANLVKAIPSQMPDEADLAEELADDLRESSEELQDLVDDAMSTAADEAEPINNELKARLDSLIAEVSSNAVIKHVDSNPFGVALTIGATLGKALSDVRAALPVPA